MPPEEAAYHGLERNRQAVMQKFNLDWISHTPPSEGHYPHRYKWDSKDAVVINTAASRHFRNEIALCSLGEGRFAELDERKRAGVLAGLKIKAEYALRRAQEECFAMYSGQHDTGMIPNVQFAGKGRGRDPERKIAFERGATGSNYDQPPVTAEAVLSTYELLAESDLDQADLFLDELYEPTKRSLAFWTKYRSNGPTDKLIGIIHPHETGRDSGPEFDIIKPLRIRRKGPDTKPVVDKLNMGADYVQILAFGAQLKRAGGDVQKQRELFWMNDVMMNCLYVKDLLHMAKLADHAWRPDDAKYYRQLAREVEKQILVKMYSVEDKIFYGLDQNGKHIKEVTVSNLFPLLLPNLPAERVRDVLDLMEKSFNTPYPLPSVATTSPNYDPHNREKHRLWRGPVWINMNWYLVEHGLLMQTERQDLPEDLRQECRKWAEKITISSFELVTKQGAYEHYDPETSQGQRPSVKNFAWSYLALIMKLLDELGLEEKYMQMTETA